HLVEADAIVGVETEPVVAGEHEDEPARDRVARDHCDGRLRKREQPKVCVAVERAQAAGRRLVPPRRGGIEAPAEERAGTGKDAGSSSATRGAEPASQPAAARTAAGPADGNRRDGERRGEGGGSGMKRSHILAALSVALLAAAPRSASGAECSSACAVGKRTCMAEARTAFSSCRATCRTSSSPGQCRTSCLADVA